MSNLINTFEPVNSNNSDWFYIGLSLALILWGLLAWVLKNKRAGLDHKQRMLLSLLVFIAAITSSGMAFFSGWAMLKTGTVKIYADTLEIGSRQYPFDQIKRISREDDRQHSIVNPSVVKSSTELLFIELQNGKLLVLSSQDYQTSPLFNSLKTAFENYGHD